MSHGRLSSAEGDVVDADFGEALPMSLLLRVVLPALHLEDDDLLVLAVLDDLTGHRSALEGRKASADVGAVGAENDVVEGDRIASLALETRDADRLPRLDTELLAAGANDGVRH